KRIQLRSTRGWRKPDGAVVVARPTKWGNPFRMGEMVPEGDTRELQHRATREDVVDEFVELIAGHLLPEIRAAYPSDDEIRAELGGHDLACWCPLSSPCHADVLLELANPVSGACPSTGAGLLPEPVAAGRVVSGKGGAPGAGAPPHNAEAQR